MFELNHCSLLHWALIWQQQQQQQQPNYCAEREATQGLSGGQARVAVLDIYGETELTAAMYNTQFWHKIVLHLVLS